MRKTQFNKTEIVSTPKEADFGMKVTDIFHRQVVRRDLLQEIEVRIDLSTENRSTKNWRILVALTSSRRVIFLEEQNSLINRSSLHYVRPRQAHGSTRIVGI